MELLQDIKDWIEDSDTWWLGSPGKGGFDVERIRKAIRRYEYENGVTLPEMLKKGRSTSMKPSID